MTRNNESSYREKGRALFLSAIMILSVVAASAAFAGAASATAEEQKDLGEFVGTQVYSGQDFTLTNLNGGNTPFTGISPGDELNLVRVDSRNDDGNISGGTQVRPLDVDSGPSVSLDTDDLESGESYFISDQVGIGGANTEAFTVTAQDFSVDFDDDTIDEFDNASLVEFDSTNRPSLTSYNYSVRVTGPDGNALDALDVKQLLELRGADGTVANAEISEETFTGQEAIDLSPMDLLDDFDVDDDDYEDDFEDAGYVTFDAGEDDFTGNQMLSSSSDEIELNASNLADGEGLPDRGEYEFEFIVADTGNTATGTITIGEADEDASFDEGSQTVAAGDIAEFSVDLSDAVGPNGNSAYVQIGGEDSDFVDVLFIEADDSAEPVTVQVNTRLLGTDAGVDAVYDRDNAETFGSEMHDESEVVDPDDATVLYGDDGDKGNNFDQYVRDLGIIDSGETADQQLTRPLQSTEYRIQVAGTTGLADDEAIFDADPGGDANNQLDSKTLRLAQPSIEGITIHTAPEEDADDITNAEDLVSVATPISEAGGEVGVNDRLIAQVEATGIFGSIVQEAGPGTADSADYDRLSEGASSEVLNALTDDDVSNESVSLSIEAGATTGNVDALEIDLTDTSDDSDVFIVPDQTNDQFFIVTDTSSDNAFTGGGGEAPDSPTQFTAELEYDADNEDDRAEFRDYSGGDNPDPYEFTSSSVNYPYFTQGTVDSASTQFTMAPQTITYDNLNADRNVQIESTEEATISASTNVAPGADAEIRISGDGFQQGQSVNISDDGSITANFNTADLEPDSDVTLDFRVSGSSVATDTGTIVEAIGDNGQETNETDTDDGEEMDDGETEPADDGETNESTGDDGESADDGESTDDGTPGFGAVVALIALIGAALLAVRRQN